MEKSPLYWLFVYAFLGCILAVAFYVRSPSHPSPPLWLDEVTRVAIIEHASSYQEFIENIGKYPSIINLSEWQLGRLGLFLFGRTELAFRLWPLVFSVLAVAGTYLFVARISTPIAGLLAAFLVATGSGFVVHAREFKPYALDLALTMWTLYAAVHFPDERNKLESFLFTGVLVLFALGSLVFCLVFPAVVLYRFRHRLPRRRDDFLLLIIPSLCFAVVYFSFLRPQQPERFYDMYLSFWASNPENWGPLIGIGIKFVEGYFLFGGIVGMVCYLVLLPLVSYRQRDGVWILLLCPFIANVGTSLLNLYPLFNRPSYFLCGLIVAAFAYLCGVLVRTLTNGHEGKGAMVGSIMLAALIGTLIVNGTLKRNLTRAMSWPADHGRKTLSVLAVQFQPGDFLEINYATVFMFLFYKEILLSTNSALMAIEPQRAFLVDRTPADLCRSFQKHAAEIPVGARVWFLTSHITNAYKFYEQIFSALGPVHILVGEAKQGLILLQVTHPPTSLACTPREKK